MYEIRNKYNVAVKEDGQTVQDGIFNVAKVRAEAFHKEDGQHYGIFKVEQVWTTQTLDEAVKG